MKSAKSINPAAAALRRGRTFRDMRASETQVTAEQLIAQAQELQDMTGNKKKEPAKLLLMTPTELAMYRQKTRADFEFNVKRSFKDFGWWMRYAKWEMEQGDVGRTRAIWERAIEHHGEKKELWRHYAEAEQQKGTAEEARDVYRRATTSLPQCSELWQKWLIMEQAAGSDDRTREVFRRWIATKPSAPYVYKLAIAFEVSRKSFDEARELLRQMIMIHNTPSSWAYYAGVELQAMGNPKRAIEVLNTALRALPSPYAEPELHVLLAESLAATHNVEAARKVYVDVCQHLADIPASYQHRIMESFCQFERQHENSVRAAEDGDVNGASTRRATSDTLIETMARLRYAADIERHKHAASSSPAPAPNHQIITTAFDAYASTVPLIADPSDRKHFVEEACNAPTRSPVEIQQRASLATLLASMYTEEGQETEDGFAKATELLQRVLNQFPHERLRNPSLWWWTAKLFAQRGVALGSDNDIAVARRVMGAAISKCSGDDIFRHYVTLEKEILHSTDCAQRVRTIYQTWLEKAPRAHNVWLDFASFEKASGEAARADEILRMGIHVLSCAAKEQRHLRARYQFFDHVDTLWRLRLKHSIGEVVSTSDRCKTATLFEELQREVTEQFFHEFDAWKERWLADKPSGSIARPNAIDATLQSAVRRMTSAMQGRVAFELSKANNSRRSTLENVVFCREEVFKRVIRERRQSVTVDATRSFAELTELRSWIELSIEPLLLTWRQFEAAHGTEESLKSIQEVAEPPKKKARLFK